MLRFKLHKAQQAALAAATNHPRSHALNGDLQDDDDQMMADEQDKAEGQETDVDPEKAKMALGAVVSLIQGLQGKKTLANAEGFKPNVDLSKVINKPSTFDGASGRFHEWRNEVQMYLKVINFPSNMQATIVQGYLRGTALEWWLQKLDYMAANEIPPPTSF